MTKDRSQKMETNRRRHNFLLDAFFKGTDSYAVNDTVDGWVLVKHINGDTGDFEVSIFTKESYQKSVEGYQKYGLFDSPKS